MNTFTKYLPIVLINLLVFLVLIKMVDLFFEPEVHEFEFYKRSLTLTEYRPNADFSITPVDAYVRGTENLAQKPYRVRTDEHGFIIGPRDLEIPPDSIEIIFFGGSTTECMMVDEDSRFPYLAGQFLSQKNGRNIAVRNAGVTGKNSMQSSLDFLIRGKKHQPKIVVLMHNINDLAQLLYIGEYFEGPESRRILLAPEQASANRSVFYRAAFHIKEFFFPNIYRILQLRMNPQNTADEWEGWRMADDVNFEDIEEQFIKSITNFINLARNYDAEVVLMTQFNRMNMDDEFVLHNLESANRGIPPFLFQYYHFLNESIRKVAEKENLLLIDLANAIPSDGNYIYDEVHLNTEGSKLAASIIADSLQSAYYSTSTIMREESDGFHQ